MKKVLKFLFLIMILLSVPISFISAHPGRTDSSGCHTCRTNCASWGLSNGQYHCHNGGSNSYNSNSNTYRQNTTTTTTKRIYGCINKEAINYNSDANISDGSCQFEKIITKTQTIDYETKIDGKLKNGNKKIIVKGQLGEKIITIKTVVNESEEEIFKEIVSEKIAKEPIDEVIKYEKITKKTKTTNSVKQPNNVISQNTNAEEENNTPLLITLFVLVFNVIFGNKNPELNLIINKIKKMDSILKYILYFLYFIFVIPIFIDIVLIISHVLKNKK